MPYLRLGLRLMVAAVAMAMVPLGAMLAPAAANAAGTAATTAGCTNGVAITQFAFNPPSVPAGSTSQLTLALQNCSTTQATQGATDWYGYYLDANGNRPPDCGVIGPVAFNYSIAAGGIYTLTNTYGSPPAGSGCVAAALQISTSVDGSAPSATADLQFAPACNGGVSVTQFSFNPETVDPDQTSPATLVLQNCTSQTITGTTVWFGQYTSSINSAYLVGCPAIDPISFPYSIAPGGTLTQTEQEGDTIAGCQADGLTSDVNVNVNGMTGTAATVSAHLEIAQPVSPPNFCHVTYQPNNWAGGFTANVTINNTSTVAINNWTLTFAFGGDQKITNAWNATVSQTGQNVSATNESYNATIPAGGSQSFGMQGTWNSSDAAPLVFFVNGIVCN